MCTNIGADVTRRMIRRTRYDRRAPFVLCFGPDAGSVESVRDPERRWRLAHGLAGLPTDERSGFT
jgi:hypothetical protein